ncbi:MAG: type II toxin-antitoxin system RelE/ParE family toxin [Bacteroidetes bacterium]|nr:type II toxin-antitoxin system RelE/ParE family toxin [Bacteroidota bacterium]
MKLWDAALYYEERAVGLGQEFFEEVERALAFAVQNPELGTRSTASTRRVLINRFPYSVIYRALENEFLVVAIAHQRRRPGYWRTRT